MTDEQATEAGADRTAQNDQLLESARRQWDKAVRRWQDMLLRVEAGLDELKIRRLALDDDIRRSRRVNEKLNGAFRHRPQVGPSLRALAGADANGAEEGPS